MNRVVLSIVIAASLTWTASLLGQTPPTPPPNVLQISREEVKPGRVAEHEKLETEWARAYARANWPTNYLAVVALTGPPEAWFITGYESFVAVEKDQKSFEGASALRTQTEKFGQQDAELLDSAQNMIAVYRDELSYGQRPDLGKMRYFSITTTRVRPGHDHEFVEARKMVKAAHEKANIPERLSMWQVTSGAPTGTYLQLVPRKSLVELDEAPKLHGSAYETALGGEEGQKKLRELQAASILSAETNHFAFNPKMSHPSKEWMDSDPTFWAVPSVSSR